MGMKITSHIFQQVVITAYFLTLRAFLLVDGHALSFTGRRVSSTGDILGIRYDEESIAVTNISGMSTASKEVHDHAHFYSAAEILTLWVETRFALSARTHNILLAQPKGASSPCVFDAHQCLFSPNNVAAPGFPLPELPAEDVLKRFAMEAFKCRGTSERASCHLDSNCGWDDQTNACFLAHDPHSDFISALQQCRDTLYSARSRTCWQRQPVESAYWPCGGSNCKLHRAGGTDGLPENRCMPDPYPPKFTPMDVYSLLKRSFGSAFASTTWAEQPDTQPQVVDSSTMERHGFGSCYTAALHHAMQTECRATDRQSCLLNSKCAWLHGIVKGEFCVLSKAYVIETLLGSSAFTKAVLRMEQACGAATSQEQCFQVPLSFS